MSKFQNIIVRKKSHVKKIEKNYIIVDDKKIMFKYLIGADGSSSMVRKYLKIKTTKIAIEFGNIFLIGDAVGLIYSFTGDGIHPAMVSGEEAGKKILDSNYNILIDEILKKKKIQYSITNLLIFWGSSRVFLQKLIIMMAKSKLFKNKIMKIFI